MTTTRTQKNGPGYLAKESTGTVKTELPEEGTIMYQSTNTQQDQPDPQEIRAVAAGLIERAEALELDDARMQLELIPLPNDPTVEQIARYAEDMSLTVAATVKALYEIRDAR